MFPMVDPSRSVDPFAINKRVSIYDDTYSLHLNCAGGPKPTEENKKRHFFSPTIVLETGLAMTSTVSWNQTLLIKLRNIGLFLNSEEGFGSDLRVCFYDRAGYGFSDSGPMPQTAKRNAEALYETLKAAEEIGPFILVGHSFGGNIIRIFAHAHSEQVAGIVFLDSDHEDRFERSAALWPAKSLDAYHAEFVNMATKMGAAGALASPFAAGDRLLVDEFSKMQVGHVYTAREIAATFKGKFFKAVSSEMLNYVHTNPPQIRKTVPYAPRTNLPVSVVIAISDITKYCTPKPRVPRDSKQFTNIDAENDTPASMCEPLHETNLAPSLAAAEAQAHFEGQWKLATQLSRVTRVLFVESSHYVVFDAPDAIVEAVEAVVLEARRFARGEFVSWHETTENQEDEELVEMEDDYF
ncbi:hypothetical protein HK100_008496 [Physocladia obscura]|uniref:AB hydrolase-1 domain-containing protein n=1 Tax=Physocladia obscura TaxID=109957 RepID=A0AAD5SN84_9FUNG|nr:hypothetical protein HK100_008496 [Physocladia obscura]